MPRALVIRAAGTNCDREMVRAFELAGAETDLLHLEALCKTPDAIDQYDLIGFPGGFSYGDDVASGRIFAMRARRSLYPALKRAAERGCPIIGVCNGFQVMAQVGLLPGPPPGAPWPDEPPTQTIALTHNAGARFIDDWVRVEVEPDSVCIWTRDLVSSDAEYDLLRLPLASGEGRLVPASDSLLDELKSRGQIALRYADNVNGSAGAVAGVCDATGRIFALMPHPDRYLDMNRHPYFTSLDDAHRAVIAPGLRMFMNAVEAVSEAASPSGA